MVARNRKADGEGVIPEGPTTSFDRDVAGVRETRVVHDVHRVATSLLADIVTSRADGVAAFRDFVVAMLEHHHAAEDDDLWAMLAARSPGLTAQLDWLTHEHDTLQHALDALRGLPLGDGDAPDASLIQATAVRDLVHEHLAHEEPVLFPALEQVLPEYEWEGFSTRTVASAPQEGLPLLIALVHEVGRPADVDLVFRHVPPEGRATIPDRRAEGDRALRELRAAARPARGRQR